MIDPVKLQADIIKIIGDSIGQYLLPGLSGTVKQAIAILPDSEYGWQYPPNGTKATGLEVLIKLPYAEVEPLIGGDRTKTYTYEIHIKQWDDRKTVREALDKLTSELPNIYLIERVAIIPASEKLLTIDQCKFFVTEWAIVSQD